MDNTMNKILIKHGSSFPTAQNLDNYELGIATINGSSVICGKVGIIQTFGALYGTKPPEEFFANIKNIPDGTIYYHIKTRG